VHNDQQSLAWFSIQVRATTERYVADHLLKRSFECFVATTSLDLSPLERISEPNALVLRSYVFCRLDIRRKLVVLMIPGVLGLVSVDGIPVPIEDKEIFSLQQAT
jgi:transcription antitermination factor NusG